LHRIDTVRCSAYASEFQVADSEDHCSVSATPVSPGEEFTNGSASKRLANAINLSLSVPKVEKDEPTLEEDVEHKIPNLGSDWNSSGDMKARQFISNHSRLPPYKQLEGFQTRMKGWQREYIKDIIKEGHYPTEEELRDIEVKCDLSRKQV
ncbi:hypothetical protein OESDEN_17947, partial [Oesophagostomum dentatum]